MDFIISVTILSIAMDRAFPSKGIGWWFNSTRERNPDSADTCYNRKSSFLNEALDYLFISNHTLKGGDIYEQS